MRFVHSVGLAEVHLHIDGGSMYSGTHPYKSLLLQLAVLLRLLPKFGSHGPTLCRGGKIYSHLNREYG